MLFLDEIHRFTKAQQDALLPGVENCWVVLVAATTENPSFAVIAPLLSRSMLVTLVPLTDDDVVDVLAAAVAQERGSPAPTTCTTTPATTSVLAGGDARRALTYLEAAAGVAEDALPPGAERPDVLPLTLAQAEQAVAHAAVRYDRTGDQHYDVASALIKLMRGSDVDAALRYTSPRCSRPGRTPPIARRVVIAASEDVGLADPTTCRPPSPRCTRWPRSACPRHGSSSRRPSSTTPWRRSPTRPTPASTRPSPTSARRGGPVPRTCGAAGTRGRSPRSRQGLRLRARRARRRRGAAVPSRRPRWLHRLPGPTDPRFEARLQDRWAWLARAASDGGDGHRPIERSPAAGEAGPPRRARQWRRRPVSLPAAPGRPPLLRRTATTVALAVAGLVLPGGLCR